MKSESFKNIYKSEMEITNMKNLKFRSNFFSDFDSEIRRKLVYNNIKLLNNTIGNA